MARPAEKRVPIERLRQEWAIKYRTLEDRHDSESEEFRCAYANALETNGIAADGMEWVALVREATPMVDENRRRFYEEHPEFKDPAEEGDDRDG